MESARLGLCGPHQQLLEAARSCLETLRAAPRDLATWEQERTVWGVLSILPRLAEKEFCPPAPVEWPMVLRR
jgi:hypothetical protein